MQCPKCLEETADGSQFCRRCGASIPRQGASSGMRVLVLVGLVLGAGLVAAAAMFMVRSSPEIATSATTVDLSPANSKLVDAKTHVGVAFGTEKRDWFTWAVEAFAQTPAARNVQIDLMPMGSLEAAQAIAHGDTSIQVWSPASAL
jgi:hypothetical protein